MARPRIGHEELIRLRRRGLAVLVPYCDLPIVGARGPEAAIWLTDDVVLFIALDSARVLTQSVPTGC